MDGGAWWATVHGAAKSQTTERLHFHFSLSCIGEGNGNPLQCSCLENPRDRGAWWAAVYGVAQSRTRLTRRRRSSSSSSLHQVRMSKRHFSVGQQTRALLGKNFLKKWRMKRETLSEWLFSCLLVLFAHLFSSNLHQVNDFPQLPAVNLGRVDNFNDSDYIIAFAPESKTTQEIMNKLASAPFIKGRTISGWPDEQSMGELELNYSTDAVRVIFNDAFSYHLKFLWGHRIPTMKEHRDHSAHCQIMDESVICEGSLFWEKGFVAFQAAINAAIIEITTNHSVMENLMSVTGINMKILPFVAQAGVLTDFFVFFCVISFSAFIYYVSVSVAQERQFMKPLMTMMGLRESAFWLSWGLMYTGFISITATLMAIIVTYAPVVILTGFTVVFTLFLLYGLSLITLAFLMSVLVKKPFLTGLVVFLLTVFWGSLGFTALYRRLPAALEWTLCLLSPFAFTAGMAQLIHLDYDVNSNIHSDSPNDQYLIIATIFMLVFDALLYLVLTLYLDKILPTEYGRQQPPWFFLKSSSWFQRRRADRAALENDIDPDSPSDDSFEPVSAEFHGKEAIRIRNLKKAYGKGKHEKVEALKGLVLEVYEGQITGILGHSGAGKTTLLNILSGLSAPTSGSVTIYNHSLSEAADLEHISKLTGVCPQANVQFGFLTVRENLRLFAKIKGIQPHEVEQQVQRVLQDLEMGNIQDVLAQNLSSGQKRKLTFGTAILGDPRVLLLDEPTAGSDPLSRHRVWNLLRERKSDHVVLFSTPFMDEADVLADLYRDLESCSNQGIENYGVSMTTLNEVFMKLEGKSAFDESGPAVSEQLQSGRNDTGSLAEPEQVVSSFSEASSTVGGLALWRQQLCAVAKVRFLKLKSEKRALLAILLLFGITFGPQLLEHLSYRLQQKSYSWGLSPNMYFLSPGQPPQAPLTRLLVVNRTGSRIDDFIHSLRRQNIDLEVDALGTRNGPSEPSYNGAITVTGNDEDPRFSIACNTKRLNCFPVLMDIISNGLLGMLNSSEHIQTDRSTYFEEHTSNEHEYLGMAFFWIPGAACFTPYIAMGSIGDHKKKVHSQLRISGLYPSAYWFGQALVDVPLYFLILLLMQIMDYVFNPDEFVFIIQSLAVQTLCIIGYVSSLVLLTYVISFIFRHGRKNSGIWSFFFLVVTFFTIVANYLNEYGFLGLFLCTILIPPFTLIGVQLIFSEISPDSVDYLGASEQQVAFLTLLIPYLHFFIFLFILRCLEMKFRKKPMRKDPVFRISPRSSAVFANPEKPEGEDEDVQTERRRTADAVAAPDAEEKPAIVASCLRKEYAGRKKNCFAKRKKKVATRNVSFCVKKGEVIGLLGHNGAGKSTTIKMITGDTRPTAGQVLLAGGSGGVPPGFLGYCPQESALWPGLTVREHLEVSAAVKGLQRADAAAAITRLADALKLQDQMALPAKALPEGAKRKLSFALSILGSPGLLLLDEPTTGMDPEGQLQTWQLIRASVRNTARGALLTTHSMAEAEAVCDRVAVMVSGSLRCIGSIQHLKSKFGRDYLLEMKLKSLARLEALHAEVLRIFPQAARQERFASLVVYKLPVEDVHPLSHAFFSLETVKQNFDLEEYSLSQCSLEQVFLELCKEQEWDNSDEEVDLSVRWKLLQEEP
ncbi:ATP-binding cassette sub-family A member 9 isoform X3 [Bos indicus]|uniref:ATP-binding cassette sub-family A member 9 isoform X3 n=1 Tax=Bos indicus TaxID=9915 RepID=A0ABM4R411_BOSIN